MPNSQNVDQDLKINQTSEKPKTVFIYKFDGSLQCSMGQAIPLTEMAKELDGIKIYSKNSKNDGMMRIQVCGSATGQANVYEIAESNLKQAINKGFKTWSAK